ncbi:protein SOGA1 isoform X2 [Scyliorhinus canicula]|uniref:protein SOGA1 isoform X2 n=1 Tax=Scyliorhinus canicula TaxID=7830 RepID=UPI0018F2A109|nr:protein SOGA1 isoform X2 [Scyliorhinus canicula]
MEAVNGAPEVQQQQVEKKRLHRAPSPARPKAIRGWSVAKSKCNPGSKPGLAQCRLSRHSPALKDGKLGKMPAGKAAAASASSSSRASKKPERGGGGLRGSAAGKRKGQRGGPAPAPGKLSPASATDSSSELSDCPSEPLSEPGDGEPGPGPSHGCPTTPDALDEGTWPAEDASLASASGQSDAASGAKSPSLDSRLHVSNSLAFSDFSEEFVDSIQEEFLKEIEELRSENDYLKDEIEELRAEMLEMRDIYLEEDVYQLQELRQELDRANKTCRILQYRLRKTERRSLRVAQTGQVDGELIRSLEQDVKVSKDVSVRLHNELEAIEKKRIKLEEENEDLRQKLIEMDVSKQVLHNEVDKMKESSLKKRGGRVATKPEKKPVLQEDSADLKCQLHFAKEEAAVMCKKLTKLVKDNENMREELVKYSSLYGDLDNAMTIGEIGESPHVREAELKLHLKLVEEEANILSRRTVELEVENRGLKAEMDDLKGHGEKESSNQDIRLGITSTSYGEFGENVAELRRHLQFVEEEAELLRRSLIELEDQNKHLMNELNRYKSESNQESTWSDSCPSLNEPSQEELMAARLQINDLNGKVKKLEYENRVLVSNLQRYDLASYHCQKCSRELDTDISDSADISSSQPRREVPVGGETDSKETQERTSGSGSSRIADNDDTAKLLGSKDLEILFSIKDQAELVTEVIDLLISDTSGLISDTKLCSTIDLPNHSFNESNDEAANANDPKLMSSINSRLLGLKTELASVTEKIDRLGESIREESRGMSPLPHLTESASFLSTMTTMSQDLPMDSVGKEYAADLTPDFRDQVDWQQDVSHTLEICVTNADTKEYRENSKEYTDKEYNIYSHEDSDSYATEVKELQLDLSEAKETIRGLQEQLVQERELRNEEAVRFQQKMSQLKEEQQKALVRRDFELQSLNLQSRLEQKFWSQEKNLFVKEADQFKQNLFLLYMKLKWFLKHWKCGKKMDNDGDDLLEVNSVKDLYLLIEEEELTPRQVDNKTVTSDDQSQKTFEEVLTVPVVKSVPTSCPKQSNEYSRVVGDIKMIVKDLCTELKEERRRTNDLQLQFANAKSTWEIEKVELKSCIAQLEGKAGKMTSEKAPGDLKTALKWEREEHQQLLAESYTAVMDLTQQLQINEKNWSQEKLELLDRFNIERSHSEQRLKEMQHKINQMLQHRSSEKETSDELEAKGTNLQRAKSVSSMSEFESLLDTSPYLPPTSAPLSNGLKDLEELNKKNWTHMNNEGELLHEKSESTLIEQSDVEMPVISSWDFTMAANLVNPHLNTKQIQRSYTAPDRTGIRIYYSPPVVRRMDGSVVQNNEEKIMIEPGFLFTMAKPKKMADSEPQSENACNKWFNDFSKHRDLLESGTGEHQVSVSANTATTGFPSALHDLQISGNMSDDMKEVANCVRNVICTSSLERKVNTASQTVGLISVGTQTARSISVGLQTESPRSISSALHRSWASRGSLLMPTQSSRSKQLSSSLEKVPTKFERPCCSPKYGSPKLQRRSSSKIDHTRERSPWALSHRGQNESAWARSTTTRDSPVLSSINDGLSSLFNVVEHTSGNVDSVWKSSQHETKTKGDSSRYGIVQEFFRNVCGRSQSPTNGADKPLKDPVIEENVRKEEFAAPAPAPVGHTQVDSISRIVNKRLPKQPNKEDQKPTSYPTPGAKDPDTRDACGASGLLEETSCDCTSQSLTSCFPSRSSARHSLSQCKSRSLPSDPSMSDEKSG